MRSQQATSDTASATITACTTEENEKFLTALDPDKTLCQNAEQQMDHNLMAHLDSLSIRGCDLPMDAGTFYQRHVLNCDCIVANSDEGNSNNKTIIEPLDVHKSSFKSVSKWLIEAEKQQLVILKKHLQGGRAYRRKTSTKQIFAVGKKQVQLYKSHHLAELPNNDESDHQEQESPLEEEDEETKQISIKMSCHAKDRQQERGISDIDIKKTIAQAKGSSITRKHDGVKIMSAKSTNVTAIVTGGHSHRVITVWKEKDDSGGDGGDYLARWTNLTYANHNTEGFLQQSTVTIVEKYQRYEKSGSTKTRKWEAGQRVRKRKKYRKEFFIVGLEDCLVDTVVKQIQNQMGIHCAIGTLDEEAWEKAIGFDGKDDENAVSSRANEGSRTVSFNLVAKDRLISKCLQHVESVVPPKFRRYFKEVKDEDALLTGQKGPDVWSVQNMNDMAEEKRKNKLRRRRNE